MRKKTKPGLAGRRVPLVLALALLSTAGSLHATSYVVPPDDVLIGKAQNIVIARASAVWVEDTTEHGIETVTEFVVEDTLKGTVPHTFRIRMPGGHFGGIFKVVPGALRFDVGQQELLFVNQWHGDYMTTDFGLGRFTLKYDDTGHHLALRDDTEIYGWDLKTHEPHRERRRIADKFIDYIRAVAAGRPAEPDYFLPDHSFSPRTNSTANSLRPATQGCSFPSCAALQYSLTFDGTESGPGGRWFAFPSAVNWNRGNTEINAGNGGSDAINAAFTAWNGAANAQVNYVLASTTSNLNGITDPHDGVNNVVFEKNLGSPFSCATGGLLGEGGTNSTSGPTQTFSGGQFYPMAEGDVSMNQGVGACIGSTLSVGDFNSAVTHEIGHTLGFRHSDKDRVNDATPCTSFSTYDCSSAAIMTAVVTPGLNAGLTTWDQHAVQTLYPGTCTAPTAPSGVMVTAASGSSISLSWTASTGSGTITYQIQRSTTGTGGFGNYGSTTTSTGFVDGGVANKTAYLYRVVASNSCGSATSAFVLGTAMNYTNTITVGGTIKAVDTNEMRDAIDAVRTLDGIGHANYTFPGNVTQRVSVGDIVYAADANDMRQNLDTAYFGMFGVHPTYTHTTITGGTSPITALDFNEIRNWMK